MSQQRDIFTDRDWFLIGLIMLAMTRLGITLIMLASYIQDSQVSATWLEGIFGLIALFLVLAMTRYNRWAYLLWVAGFAIMGILGLLQMADAAQAVGMYRYAGVLNVVYGAVFTAGLLARWRDFMGSGREGPGVSLRTNPTEPPEDQSHERSL